MKLNNNNNKELYSKLINNNNNILNYSISDFKGYSIAINASLWLYQGIQQIIEHFIDNNLNDYLFYVDIILLKIKNFRIVGVEPVMIFNGKRNIIKVYSSFLLTFLF